MTTANETKACPMCGEEIKAAAQKCKHCGEGIKTTIADETTGLNKLLQRLNTLTVHANGLDDRIIWGVAILPALALIPGLFLGGSLTLVLVYLLAIALCLADAKKLRTTSFTAPSNGTIAFPPLYLWQRINNTTNKPQCFYTALGTLSCLLLISFSFSGEAKEIEMIKTGIMKDYPLAKIGEILPANFESSVWEVDNKNGKTFVTYAGEISQYLHEKACRIYQAELDVEMIKQLTKEHPEHPISLSFNQDFLKSEAEIIGNLQKEKWDALKRSKQKEINERVIKFQAPLEKATMLLNQAQKELDDYTEDIRKFLVFYLEREKRGLKSSMYADYDIHKSFFKQLDEDLAKLISSVEQDPFTFFTEGFVQQFNEKFIDPLANLIEVKIGGNTHLEGITRSCQEMLKGRFHYGETTIKPSKILEKVQGLIKARDNSKLNYDQINQRVNAVSIKEFKEQCQNELNQYYLEIDRRRVAYETAQSKLHTTYGDLLDKYLQRFTKDHFWKVGEPVTFQWVLHADGENFDLTEVTNTIWDKEGLTRSEVLKTIFAD